MAKSLKNFTKTVTVTNDFSSTWATVVDDVQAVYYDAVARAASSLINEPRRRFKHRRLIRRACELETILWRVQCVQDELAETEAKQRAKIRKTKMANDF